MKGNGAQSLGGAETEVRLRITLRIPPVGVTFCLQRGAAEHVDAKESAGEDLTFHLTVRALDGTDEAPLRLMGPFTQGPPAARFVYVCSGVRAGQIRSCWDRRAKVPLTAITPDQIRAAAKTGDVLAATIEGRAKDGGPCCAGVKLLGRGWTVGK